MQLDQAQTLKRLDRLHARQAEGSVNFKVSLSRVGTSTAQDAAFTAWCAERFPLFPSVVGARFDWIGQAQTEGGALAPDVGCVQWFTLHILATGVSAFCCIDGDGLVQEDHIDTASLFEIYNLPVKRRARETLTSRKALPGCRSCVHGMPANAYQR